MLRIYGCCAAVVVMGGLLHGGDWPAYRGPQGDGTSPETGLPVEWSREKNVVWKVALPAPGNGSPIVVKGKIFLVSASKDGKTRSLVCLDRKNGQQLWEKSITVEEVEPTHETNPYGSASPVTDGERVVVCHGSGGIYCYDLEGKELWRQDLGKWRHIWGYGPSPVIHGGKVFQWCGPGKLQFLIALDLKSGETVWRHDEPGGDDNDSNPRYVGSWSTPIVTEAGGKEVLLVGMPTRVGAFEPDSGKLVWFCNGVSSDRGDLMYTSPLVAKGIGVVMGGYEGPAMGFQLGGSGDITETGRVWHAGNPAKRNPQRIGTGVIVGDQIYIANADDVGSMQCLDLTTGRERWKERRLGGGPHWGSMIFAEGRLYVTGQNGTTHVMKPNPDKFERLAQNELGEHCNSTPAFSDGQIFVRTHEALWCIGKK